MGSTLVDGVFELQYLRIIVLFCQLCMSATITVALYVNCSEKTTTKNTWMIKYGKNCSEGITLAYVMLPL